jgi:hypothetical protein
MPLKSIGIVSVVLLSCLALSVIAAPKETTPGGELLRPAGATTKPQKFVAATKEQSDAAIAAAKKRGAEVEDVMKVKFGIIESPHFIIFTDWDKREYDFLRSNMEAAYEIVSRQFEIPVKDNVFIGKLPVYMFAKQEDFQKFSRDADGSEAPANVLGYYMGNNLGFGHMTMWKPKPGSTKKETSDAERKWATVLTHEFTHAFVARYRTNNFIPRWLNEGLAEVVAHKQFPRAYPIYPYVRDRQTTRGGSIQDVLTDKGMLSGDDYPVAQTVVETLLVGQPKSFLPFFNDIKDGMSAEEALQKEYKTDLKGLENNWKQYIKNAK